jgi:adenosylcobinamide-GDP ribazoletransferase
LLVGVLWSVPALALVLVIQGPARTAAMVAMCALAALVLARMFRRRLQGFTGDGLGATQQVCELAIYLAMAWQA